MENMTNKSVEQFVLNNYCMGFSELKDNCCNSSIIANDPNVDVFTNEYYAGYIQGKLQGLDAIMAARNNVWNNTYLCDTSEPEYKFPQNFDPSEEELAKAAKCLLTNYKYLYTWIKENEANEVAQHIKRLLYRMMGICDSDYPVPQKDATFERIDPERMNPLKLELRYRIQVPSFMDIYFINAQSDLFDVLASSKESCRGLHKSDHCSAFVKRTADDIFWTHNTWAGFLCQSHTISYAICGDFVTQNSYCPGQFGSNMDFGFNGHGICFNETTHRYSYAKPKADGIWLCWRAAAAEMFAKSINDFYNHLTIDNTGTYLNGYMLIDVNTNETALIEMSYKRFVKFLSDGNSLTVNEKITEAGKTTEKTLNEMDYDQHLITPNYILGVNYPISKGVAYDLESTDNRPMRRIQFYHNINSVQNMETAKALITYVDNDNPLSIYGRWDLDKGITEYPKTIPDGAVDAKVYSASNVRELLKYLRYTPNKESEKTAFWMLYGTPEIDGTPFVWSESQWAEYKKRQDKDFVPDRLEGAWNETKLFMD